jgi:hypothetical protein
MPNNEIYKPLANETNTHPSPEAFAEKLKNETDLILDEISARRHTVSNALDDGKMQKNVVKQWSKSSESSTARNYDK